ncbi:hypothetical protein [Methylobacterium sp. CCH5-D2]|uniref:hypothetical protein n=1 Tax=Methylobacterium sp. CCH5-D2 TaxID=1768765 RepID=UPI000833F1E8|nr:hypothetical protein [Methylobacterium sp. CCH5-D2]
MTTKKLHPVSGVPYADLKAEARARRAAGERVAAIALALDVKHPAVVKWCQGMPEHDAATRANVAARAERRRIYPKGHSAAERVALTRLGLPVAERARILAARTAQTAEARA